MKKLAYATGNQSKADRMAKYLGVPIEHVKLDLEELQTMDLEEIIKHKVYQAYDIVKRPVIVDDVSFWCVGLGGLPGPFVKFFLEHLEDQALCSLLDGKDRSARATCTIAYYDGNELKIFVGELQGKVAMQPHGDNGFGWDAIFEPEGYGGRTRAELNDAEYEEAYRKYRAVDELEAFFQKRGYHGG